MQKMYKKVGFIFLLVFLFLFAPKPNPNSYCGSYISVNKFMGALVDCDSYQYILLAIRPASLLDRDNVARRQNRPLYIGAAYCIGLPIQYLLNIALERCSFLEKKYNQLLQSDSLKKKIAISLDKTETDKNITLNNQNLMKQIIPYFMGYILLNFLLLLFSIYLFLYFLKYLGILPSIYNTLFLIIVINGIVKKFIWSAHEQMFLFLTPILIVYFLYKYVAQQKNRTTYFFTFLFGIGCLAYGSFVLYLPSLFLLLFLEDKSIRNIVNNILNYLIHTCLFFIPTVTWVFICKKISGHYYNHEVENFREIVWMSDALKISFTQFGIVFFKNTAHFLFIFTRAVLPFLIVYYWLKNKNKFAEKTIEYKKLTNVLNVTFIVFTLFFALLGYYSYRLCFSSSIIILIGIATELQILYENNPLMIKRYQRNMYVLLLIWSILVFLF